MIKKSVYHTENTLDAALDVPLFLIEMGVSGIEMSENILKN